DRHRHRTRLPSGAAPPRLPSDRRGLGVRRRDDGRQAARPLRARARQRVGDHGLELGRPVCLRQRRRRHQAAAPRPRRPRGAAGEGVQAALLAEQGVEGPPGVIEARDGFMQAFAYASPDEARPIALPPDAPFGVTDCYIKPNPCCRHIQPATEALIALLKDEGIATEEVKHVAVETYRIAAEHAATGWEDFASSQLSFRYLMALALKFRAIPFQYFDESVRR